MRLRLAMFRGKWREGSSNRGLSQQQQQQQQRDWNRTEDQLLQLTLRSWGAWRPAEIVPSELLSPFPAFSFSLSFFFSPATRIARLIGLFAGKRSPIYRRERTVRENVIVAKVIKVGRAGQQLDTLF